MKITFINHSGFLIEWEHCVWLIDYYHGRIPDFDQSKKLLIFCSHSHSDHFNARLFRVFRDVKTVSYLLSADIKPAVDKLALAAEQLQQIEYIEPDQSSRIADGAGAEVTVETLNSTDCGVAFLMKYQGKTVYHAGDLNCWVWQGEPAEDTRRMTAAYIHELRKLKSLAGHIDVAFVPLDPRQEEWYAKGLLGFFEEVGAARVFPMHFWGRYEIIRQFPDSPEGRAYREYLAVPEHAGESWEI